MKKVVIALSICCFMINNVTFALAPSLMLGELGRDTYHHKYLALAKIGLQRDLKVLDGLTNIDNSESIQEIREAFHRFEEQNYVEKTNPEHNPASITSYFNMVEHVGGHVFMVPISVEKKGVREDYRLLFSTIRDKDQGFPTVLCTEKELAKYRSLMAFRDRLPIRSKVDEVAISRYMHQEEGIDIVLKYAHDNGLAKEPIQDLFPYKKKIQHILSKLKIDVNTPDGLLSLEDRKIFFVKKTPEIMQMMNVVKSVDGSGEQYDIRYNAHSSNNAVHIFVNEDKFEVLTNRQEASITFDDSELLFQLSHEIGVMLGYPIEDITSDYLEGERIYNAISKRWERSLHGEGIGDRLKASVADLDKNLIERDYALGNLEGSRKELRTFMQYCQDTYKKSPEDISELELFMLWSLYLTELSFVFFKSNDWKEAYSHLYGEYSEHLEKSRIDLRCVRSYVPIIRKPFVDINEVKDYIDTSTEWSINYLPEPADWKGASLFNFVLCVMNDSQVNMGVYGLSGVIKEFRSDVETERALKEIGLIGGDGILVLIRSSLREELNSSCVPGIADSISLCGHSHPKGAGITPSGSASNLGSDFFSQGDLGLTYMKYANLPAEFPVDEGALSRLKDLAGSKQDKTSGKRNEKLGPRTDNYNSTGKDKELMKSLSDYAIKLGKFAEKTSDPEAPLGELALYLRTLVSMYEKTISRCEEWERAIKDKGSVPYYKYDLYSYRAEFAGELAYHPMFQEIAKDMLQTSYDVAMELFDENREAPYILDGLSSRDETCIVMDQLFTETARHPELRELALDIINDPVTYGLNGPGHVNYPDQASEDIQADSRTKKPYIQRMIGVIKSTVYRVLSKANDTYAIDKEDVINKEMGRKTGNEDRLDITSFRESSDEIIEILQEDQSEYSITRDAVTRRAKRLLVLADACAKDDLELAKKSLEEYRRMLSVFNEKVNFYCAVTIIQYEEIMTNSEIRPLLLDIVNNIKNKEDKSNMLINIASQLMREKDYLKALEALEKAEKVTSKYVLYEVLSLLMDVEITSKGYYEKTVQRIGQIIADLSPTIKDCADEKVRLFVMLGNRFYYTGFENEAQTFYNKAWEVSCFTEEPVIIRLKYMLPLMREKGIDFPIKRTDVLEEVKRIAEKNITGTESIYQKPDVMILLAREYAFAGEYEKVEECVKFIRSNMKYPQDACDDCYEGMLEAAIVAEDDIVIKYIFSKKPYHVDCHFAFGMDQLIERGKYENVLRLANKIMEEGCLGNFDLERLNQACLGAIRDILVRDDNERWIGPSREVLKKILNVGINSADLERLLSLVKEFPALDPNGDFIFTALKAGFENNRSAIKHTSHRVILKVLRKLIQDKVSRMREPEKTLADVCIKVERDMARSESGDMEKVDNVRSLPTRALSAVIVREKFQNSDTKKENTVVDDALAIIPQEYNENGMNRISLVYALNDVGGLGLDMARMDKKSALIFSERVTFDNGVGVLLAKLTKAGIKVAVIAKNDKERQLIDELNDKELHGKENKIIYIENVVEAVSVMKHIARFYYFKLPDDPQEATLPDNIEIIDSLLVKQIIESIGRASGVVSAGMIEKLHEASRQFAIAV